MAIDEIVGKRYYLVFGVWRSPVAHLVWDQGVQGSNPCTPTTPSESGLSMTTRFCLYKADSQSSLHPLRQDPPAALGRKHRTSRGASAPHKLPIAQLDRASAF